MHTIPCFADLTPAVTPVELTAFIGCVFFLVAGWNQLEKFLDRRANRATPHEIHPQPLAVAKVDPPVCESLCQCRRKEVANELARVDQELVTLRQGRRADVGDLQQKINKVDREVGELRACLDLNNQQLMRIDAKLDRVIERQHK
jgi:hypothetical protein